MRQRLRFQNEGGKGNAYVDEAQGDSDVTLGVDVEGGVGEIKPKVV